MGAENDVQQRKQPTQDRARTMVDRIVSASGRVLETHGYAGCSTNRVAEAAGVSKGSVYQYFADKDEILTALARRTADALMDDVGSAIDGLLGGDIWQLGRGVLEATFDAVERRRGILRPLLLDAPHIDLIGMASPVRRRAHDLARTYMALNPEEFRTDLDADAAIFVLFSGLTASIVAYVTGATDLSRERLSESLSRLAIEGLSGRERPAGNP